MEFLGIPGNRGNHGNSVSLLLHQRTYFASELVFVPYRDKNKCTKLVL